MFILFLLPLMVRHAQFSISLQQWNVIFISMFPVYNNPSVTLYLRQEQVTLHGTHHVEPAIVHSSPLM